MSLSDSVRKEGRSQVSTAKLRVLLAHNRYRSPGGEERHIDFLEEHLSSVGVETCRLEVETLSNVSVIDKLKIGLGMTYRRSGGTIIRERLACRPADVVHFHNTLPLLTPAAFRGARQSGAGVVATIHNYRFACPAGTLLRNGTIHEDCIEGSSLRCGLKNPRGEWSESIAYGLAIELHRRLRLPERWVDAFIAPSEFIASLFRRSGMPREKIQVIYHAAAADPQPSTPGNTIVYAGRLSSEKGIGTLLSAAKYVPDIPFIVVGDGPLAHLLENRPPNVDYVGNVSWSRVCELKREALVTVIPSECYEGQPLGMVESMAVGTPVVGSDLGGVAEVISHGRNGMLVPPQDALALATTLDMLSRDRTLVAELGAEAWRYAQCHFNPETQISRLIEVYSAVSSSVRAQRAG